MDEEESNKMEVGEQKDVDEDVSSDEDCEDVDAESQKMIDSITEKLSTSPFDYESHIELIKILRRIGELEKLQEARMRMSAIFPLTEVLWLEWIEDEKKFAETEEEHEKVVQLFERAVDDYICPEIWHEYCQYSIRWMGTEDGMQKVRDVMDRAISAVGLHVTQGTNIWETYREFENAVLLTLQPQAGEINNEEMHTTIKTQIGRIESLYKRQLSVPLQGMERTFTEFKDMLEGEVEPGVRSNYDRTLKQLGSLMRFEDALAAASPPRLDEYQAYIQHETKSGNLARIQCVYERAIKDNCLSSELWLQYLKCLNLKLKRGDTVVKAHHRSVRNCPWIGKLWGEYLLALERNEEPQEKIKNVFDEALAAGFATPGEYVDLWMTRCSQIRRRLTKSENDTEIKESLRDSFKRATKYISETLATAFNDSGDHDFTVWRFWANCEAGCMGNKEGATDILQGLLQGDVNARRRICVWTEWYNIERIYGEKGETEQCRSILRQAVQNCAIMPGEWGGMPDAQVACEMLLAFEREHGTLEEKDESMRRIANKMDKVIKRREKDVASSNKYFQKSERKQPNKGGKGPAKKRKLSDDGKQREQSNDAKPYKAKEKGYHAQPKRSRGGEGTEINEEGFKPPGLPKKYEKNTAFIQGDQKQVADGTEGAPPSFKAPSSEFKAPPPPGFKGPPPPGFKGPPPPGAKVAPPPGFKPAPGKMDVNNNKELELGKESSQTQANPAEESTEQEKSTVFVSNIDFKLDNVENRLRKIFQACGTILDIRLAMNNKGQFRGFGFVQFQDEKSVQEALKCDREDIDGRPMFVSPNVDKKKNPNFKVFKYELGLEKHKLFVSNLSFHTTEETLMKEFSTHGDIKNLRIVTNRSGRSKGLAYIEYQNEGEAAQAVMKMDGKEIDGFEIKVAISNPPARRVASSDPNSSLGGGGGRDQFKGGRGRGRTQLSMMPRALRTTESNPAKDGATSSQGMSNKDFAAMLLKK